MEGLGRGGDGKINLIERGDEYNEVKGNERKKQKKEGYKEEEDEYDVRMTQGRKWWSFRVGIRKED